MQGTIEFSLYKRILIKSMVLLLYRLTIHRLAATNHRAWPGFCKAGMESSTIFIIMSWSYCPEDYSDSLDVAR